MIIDLIFRASPKILIFIWKSEKGGHFSKDFL